MQSQVRKLVKGIEDGSVGRSLIDLGSQDAFTLFWKLVRQQEDVKYLDGCSLFDRGYTYLLSNGRLVSTVGCEVEQDAYLITIF